MSGPHASSDFGGGIDLSAGIDPQREFPLATRPETSGFREAVNVWIEADDGSVGMRLGIEALADEWDAHDVWFDLAYSNGRVLSKRAPGNVHPVTDKNGAPIVRGAGPLAFKCIEPFTTWTVSYKGLADELTAEMLITEQYPDILPETEVDIEVEMSMAVPPWIPGALSEKAAEVLKGDEGDFMSPRYEQLFRAKGRIIVDGKTKEFSGNGLRIRRQGIRKFAGFQGHCWQSAVFPSGKAFGFNIYPPKDDGTPNFAEGYIYEGSGVLIPANIISVPWLTELRPHGDDVSFKLEVDGRIIDVRGETFINTRSRINSTKTVLPPNFPIVQQAHARYWWDGEETCGMVERSSLPSVMKGL